MDKQPEKPSMSMCVNVADYKERVAKWEEESRRREKFPFNSTARIYKDVDGNDVTLRQLIKLEPEWAHSRIKVLESLEKEVAELKASRAKELRSAYEEGWGNGVRVEFFSVNYDFNQEWDKSDTYKSISEEDESKYVVLDVYGQEWMGLVSFICSRREDIEADIEDLGGLEPMLKYFNRNINNNTKEE